MADTADLDSDQPVDGLAPITQSQMLASALADRLPADEVNVALDEQAARSRSL